MGRIHPSIFTEIALSLIPLANSPTWVKALWVEKELEERGLWRDDVFDLVRPFLISSKTSDQKPEPSEIQRASAKRDSIVEPVDPRPEIRVSKPVMTESEAKWAPKLEEFDDSEEVVEDENPLEPRFIAEYEAISETGRDRAEVIGDQESESLEPDDNSVPELWQSRLKSEDLTPEEADLASIMHLIAVSARASDDTESETPTDAPQIESDPSHVASGAIEPETTGEYTAEAETKIDFAADVADQLPSVELWSEGRRPESEILAQFEPQQESDQVEEIEVVVNLPREIELDIETVPEKPEFEVILWSELRMAEEEIRSQFEQANDLPVVVESGIPASSEQEADELASVPAIREDERFDLALWAEAYRLDRDIERTFEPPVTLPELPAVDSDQEQRLVAEDRSPKLDEQPVASQLAPSSEMGAVDDHTVSDGQDEAAKQQDDASPTREAAVSSEAEVLLPEVVESTPAEVPVLQSDVITPDSASTDEGPAEIGGPKRQAKLTTISVGMKASSGKSGKIAASARKKSRRKKVVLESDIARESQKPVDASADITTVEAATVSSVSESTCAETEKSAPAKLTEPAIAKQKPVASAKKRRKPAISSKTTERTSEPTVSPVAEKTPAQSAMAETVAKVNELETTKLAPVASAKKSRSKSRKSVASAEADKRTAELTVSPVAEKTPAQSAMAETVAKVNELETTKLAPVTSVRKSRKSVASTKVAKRTTKQSDETVAQVAQAQPELVEREKRAEIEETKPAPVASTKKTRNSAVSAKPEKPVSAIKPDPVTKTAPAQPEIAKPEKTREPIAATKTTPVTSIEKSRKSASPAKAEKPVSADKTASVTKTAAVQPVITEPEKATEPRVAKKRETVATAKKQLKPAVAAKLEKRETPPISVTVTTKATTQAAPEKLSDNVDEKPAKPTVSKAEKSVAKFRIAAQRNRELKKAEQKPTRKAPTAEKSAVKSPQAKPGTVSVTPATKSRVSNVKSQKSQKPKKAASPPRKQSTGKTLEKILNRFKSESSARKKGPKKDLVNMVDAAGIADFYGLHIRSSSEADRGKLLFFDSVVKAQEGDWEGSEERLEAALETLGDTLQARIWRQAIEQTMKIHSKLNRPAA